MTTTTTTNTLNFGSANFEAGSATPAMLTRRDDSAKVFDLMARWDLKSEDAIHVLTAIESWSDLPTVSAPCPLLDERAQLDAISSSMGWTYRESLHVIHKNYSWNDAGTSGVGVICVTAFVAMVLVFFASFASMVGA